MLESEESSRQSLQDLLAGAGYEASTTGSCEHGLRLATEGHVDLVLLDEKFSGLDCGDLVAAFKGASVTADLRVVLLASGGAAERVRALGLGADEVLTRHWDPAELLARVRVQLRLKKEQKEMRDRLRIAERGQEISRTAFEALAVTESMARDASSLGLGLKVGTALLFVAIAVMAVLYYRFARRATSETQRSSAIVARLTRNITNQQELIERALKLGEQMQTQASASPHLQKQPLERQAEEPRARLTKTRPNQAGTLAAQGTQTEGGLRRTDAGSFLAESIIRTYAPSVCLIHVSLIFRDANGGALHYAGLTAQGEPIQDSTGNPLVAIEGPGPEVRADVLGTGFLISKEGQILTNHHVVEPWWRNDALRELTEQGLRPVITEMSAYFPQSPSPYPLTTERISQEADLALIRGKLEGVKGAVLHLDGKTGASVRGEQVLLMGYATGLDAVLARADESTVREIVAESKGDAGKILRGLAQKDLIHPLITQGHLGDVLADKIIYDAQTTSGGSGGPLFNEGGKVIGINYAVLEGFGGSNFGIPARFGERLLELAPRTTGKEMLRPSVSGIAKGVEAGRGNQ